MSKNWYSIKASADNKSAAEVYIFDHIGYWDISARSFIDELKAIDADQIDLHINSPGGSVFDGVAIQNSIKHHKANVTVYIDGIAGSIASIIALSGDQIYIADNAYVMIHNPSSIVWGEAQDMLKEAEVLDKLADGLAGDYARQMDITTDEARALMDAETWYLGQEAVDAGYADSTFAGTQAAASFDLKRFSAKAPKAAIDRFTQTLPQGDTTASANPTEETMSDKTAAAGAAETNEGESQTNETATDVVDQGTATGAETTASLDQPQDVQSVVDDAVKAALDDERKRTAEITALGNKFGFSEDAETFIAEGKTVSEFQAHVLNKSPDDWKESLSIKNPSQQASESDLEATKEGDDAVARIKERRKASFATA